MEHSPILFLASNPGPMTGARTNTWLLDGPEPALIDAGVGAPDHIRAVGPASSGPPARAPSILISAYLSHRREREEQVRACLTEGLTDTEAIVARIYRGLPASLRSAARLTILAHLDKLERKRSCC